MHLPLPPGSMVKAMELQAGQELLVLSPVGPVLVESHRNHSRTVLVESLRKHPLGPVLVQSHRNNQMHFQQEIFRRKRNKLT